jgi:DNA-binding GntR family transcriptional regulator
MPPSRPRGRITRRQLAGMRLQCDRFQRLIDDVVAGKYRRMEGDLNMRLSDCELGFHSTLVKAGGNPMVSKMLQQFQILGQVFEAMRNLAPPLDAQMVARLEENQREHLEILKALRRGDAEAAREALVRHFATGLRLCLMDLARDRAAAAAAASAAAARAGGRQLQRERA